MKKTHLVLLLVTVLTAISSAYSLTAINQVYKLRTEWFSQYASAFTGEGREFSKDQWQMPEYPKDMQFYYFGDKNDLNDFKKDNKWLPQEVLKNDFNKYVLLYGSLGEVYSPEYRIKFRDIAQRGGVVEVRVSLNSPAKKKDGEEIYNNNRYMPYDILRIEKSSFPVRGELLFIYKNQNGNQLFQKQYRIK